MEVECGRGQSGKGRGCGTVSETRCVTMSETGCVRVSGTASGTASGKGRRGGTASGEGKEDGASGRPGGEGRGKAEWWQDDGEEREFEAVRLWGWLESKRTWRWSESRRGRWKGTTQAGEEKVLRPGRSPRRHPSRR